MDKAVLLVVDIQTVIMEEHPYNEVNFLEGVMKMIAYARAKGMEVIYVRHNDGPGSNMEYGSREWQIYNEITPLETDKIFEKRYNSAFRQTGLKEYLDSKDINKIYLVGLQTEYCIDATCKSAFEQEYEVIIPEGTNSTVDNQFMTGKQVYEYFNFALWNNRFAKVIPLEEILNQ